MKFDLLYPRATLDDRFDFEGSFVFRGDSVMPCTKCGEDTRWIDGNFSAHLCSEKCNRALRREYFDALTKDQS